MNKRVFWGIRLAFYAGLLAIAVSAPLGEDVRAAQNPLEHGNSFRHPSLGQLVSLPSSLVPKWGRVRRDLQARGSKQPGEETSKRLASWERWARLQSVRGGVDRERLAEGILRRLRAVRYREDGEVDKWQTAAETLERMAGDCEDQAILGLQLALAAGIGIDDAGIAVGYDRLERPHAVLALFEGETILVIDMNEASVQEISASGFSTRMMTFVDRVWVTRQ